MSAVAANSPAKMPPPFCDISFPASLVKLSLPVAVSNQGIIAWGSSPPAAARPAMPRSRTRLGRGERRRSARNSRPDFVTVPFGRHQCGKCQAIEWRIRGHLFAPPSVICRDPFGLHGSRREPQPACPLKRPIVDELLRAQQSVHQPRSLVGRAIGDEGRCLLGFWERARQVEAYAPRKVAS